MDENTIVDLLEELAETFGLQITYEPIRLDEELGTRPGGFCVLKGRPLIIINPNATSKKKIKLLAEALKQFELDRVYILPVLRQLLEKE